MSRLVPATAGRLRFLDARPAGSARQVGTLVLVHAFPLNASMWQPQDALSALGWRIVAPQLRGLEGEAAGPPAASMDDYAADVVDLLDALHVHEAVIGGLSLGGYVTLAVFRRAPQYFRGMILADTRAESDTPEGLEGRRRMLDLLAHKGPAAVAEAMLPRLLSEDTRRNRPDVVDRVDALMRSASADGIAGAIAAMMTRQDSTALLSAIRCPAVVIVGEHDQLTPPAASRDMHRAIPGSELVTIPGAGHLSNLEKPDAFNRALGGFLERHF
jgi:pimeloyl-ACP methyl ester carboxylesterase